MREMVEGLENPHPLGLLLPGVYQEDGFAQRLLQGLDEVLAPVFLTLDSFYAYLDPRLAPEDFLGWLAGLVALDLDDRWPLERRRELVLRAVELYGRQGTPGGLRDLVEAYTGGRVEVTDTGGSTWSSTPDAPLPGTPQPRVRVRVSGADVGRERLQGLLAAHVPAHVVGEVEVVPT